MCRIQIVRKAKKEDTYMLYENTIWLGSSSKAVCLLPEMANRHGLITGAVIADGEQNPLFIHGCARFPC